MLVRRRCLSVEEEEEERGVGGGDGDGDGDGVGREVLYMRTLRSRFWKRDGREVVVVVVGREEICLCKRENLEREVQGTKTCRQEHHQNK